MYAPTAAALVLLTALALPEKPAPEAASEQTVAFSATSLVVPNARAYRAPAATGELRLKSVEASVTVEERVASVRLEVAVENGAAADLTAQLLVPLPRRSKLREVSVVEPAAPLAATVRRGKNAAALWTAAARHVASLEPLEFASHDAIRTAKLSIGARATRRIAVVYESELPDLADRLDLTIPRTGGPDASGIDWKVTATLRASRPIATVFSLTHEVAATHKDRGETEVKVANAQAAPGPISISALYGGPEPAATFLTYPDPDSEGGYFAMVGAMPKGGPARAPRPREVLFVLDRSGSMGGEKIEQARRAILKSIRRLRDGEAFNIVDYASDVERFAPQPVVKDARTTELAEQYVRGIRAGGGTNLNDALVGALALTPTPSLRPMVLFVTDGMPTEGETREGAIRANARAANVHGRAIHTVGIGHAVNAPLLAGLADASGGSCRFVGPGEDVEAGLVEAFDRAGGAALANARLEAAVEGLVADVVPARLGDLQNDEQFVVLGRYFGSGPVQVRLAGDDAPGWDFTIDPSANGRGEPAVARLWAARKIAATVQAIAEAPRDGDTPPDLTAAATEIVRLALEHGVETDATRFLFEPKVDLSNRDRLVQLVFARLAAAAEEARHGAGAVARTLALRQRQSRPVAPVAARDAGGPTVLYAGDTALVRRDDLWVDLRLLERGASKPESVVKADSAGLDAARDALVRQRRAGAFAFRGAVVEVGGKAVQLGR